MRNSQDRSTTASSPRPLKRLADALHDCVEPSGRAERTERLASALQACLNEAVESGAKRAEVRIEEKWGPRFDKQDAAIREMREHMDERLDRQDATLRHFWRHMKGNGSLPIDD